MLAELGKCYPIEAQIGDGASQQHHAWVVHCGQEEERSQDHEVLEAVDGGASLEGIVDGDSIGSKSGEVQVIRPQSDLLIGYQIANAPGRGVAALGGGYESLLMKL